MKDLKEIMKRFQMTNVFFDPELNLRIALSSQNRPGVFNVGSVLEEYAKSALLAPTVITKKSQSDSSQDSN